MVNLFTGRPVNMSAMVINYGFLVVKQGVLLTDTGMDIGAIVLRWLALASGSVCLLLFSISSSQDNGFDSFLQMPRRYSALARVV